jgi:hypothetical protein
LDVNKYKSPLVVPVSKEEHLISDETIADPTTSSARVGLALPIPTRLFVESTFSVLVSTVRSPVMVALAKVAVGEQASRLFSVTFLVVPLAAIDVSETSTMTSGSLAGSVPVPVLARAVIFESGMV